MIRKADKTSFAEVAAEYPTHLVYTFRTWVEKLFRTYKVDVHYFVAVTRATRCSNPRIGLQLLFHT
jgi:hypothetical protein